MVGNASGATPRPAPCSRPLVPVAARVSALRPEDASLDGLLRVDSFPAGVLSADKEASAALDEERGRPSSCPHVTDPHVCILDVIDDSNGGRTLSQARCSRSLPEKLCLRCAMAARGAVESFLESSSRSHVDMCAID